MERGVGQGYSPRELTTSMISPGLDGRGDKLDEISQSLPIPEFKIGWIIGKKGSYIVQLAQKSGATITVSEGTSKEYGIVWKYVQISGSRRAVDRAKKLLHIRLERFEPRDEGAMPEEGEGQRTPADQYRAPTKDVNGGSGAFAGSSMHHGRNVNDHLDPDNYTGTGLGITST